MTISVGFLGAGNMAEAIARPLCGSSEYAVSCFDINQVRLGVFAAMGAKTLEEAKGLLDCDVVVLAVKPQVMGQALSALAGEDLSSMVFVSIAAGLDVTSLEAWLPGATVVRTMPNTPMMVGVGAVGVYYPASLDAALRSTITGVFALSASVVEVASEADLDTVTAVSGSGPAYFFYLMEAMIAAGKAEGLSDSQARELAAATCVGAGRMVQERPDAVEDLRKAVTSPGGTTQAAIEVLDNREVSAALEAAVLRAGERCRELKGG